MTKLPSLTVLPLRRANVFRFFVSVHRAYSKCSIHIQAWLCEGRPQGDQILPESPVQQASLSANYLPHDSDRQLI
jgi:hypothetical protein